MSENLLPIVLVHGWGGTGAVWDIMKGWFEEEGYQCFAPNLPSENNITNAQFLEQFIDTVLFETGAAKVHLIGHSMGGLSARYYLKILGHTDDVATYISMGTHHYGRSGTGFLGENGGGQTDQNSSFLKTLNAADDTPGDLLYVTMWSYRDDANSCRLDGGACFVDIPGVPHWRECRDSLFFNAALKAIRGICPGQMKTLDIK